MKKSLSVTITRVECPQHGAILLEDFSVSIDQPGVIWIQGPNGSGKSLVASVVAGKAFFPASGLTVDGCCCLRTSHGRETTATAGSDACAYAANVSYWPQKIGESLVAIYHQDDLCSCLEGKFPQLSGNTSRQKDRKAVQELQWVMEELSVGPHLAKRLGQCSYGETRRIELAAALAAQPELIVADEPFSGLDAHWRGVVAKLVDFTVRNRDCIWVITSHEPPSRYGISADIVVEIGEDEGALGPYLDCLALVAEHMESSPVAPLEPIEAHDLRMTRRYPRPTATAITQFTAEPGELTWICGNNGTGKSTLARTLSGLIFKSRLRGTGITGYLAGGIYEDGFVRGPRSDVRMVMQDPYQSFVHRSVGEDVRRPLCPVGDSSQPIAPGLEEVLASVSRAWGPLGRRSTAFSFGQLRVLQLLLLPVTAPILVFDEPLLGLHPVLQSKLLDTIRRVSRSGRIVISTAEDAGDALEADSKWRLVSAE